MYLLRARIFLLIKLEPLPDILRFLTREKTNSQGQFFSFVLKLILLVKCSEFLMVHFYSYLSPHSSSQDITAGSR